MALADALHRLPHAELRARIAAGHPVDPEALAGWTYRGTSLGLPRWVERLSWKHFQKTFHRDGAGRLVGWNLRLDQRSGLPRERAGQAWSTWHYEVVSPAGIRCPPGFDRGLIIDYTTRRQPLFDSIRFARDPLVALHPDDPGTLLGVTWLDLGVPVETPTYFLLERAHRTEHVPAAVRDGSLEPGFSAGDRRRAEALFEAILARDLSAIDRAFFWHALGARTPPWLPAGLRATVWGLELLPLRYAGFRRPFSMLDERARAACVRRMEADAAAHGLFGTIKQIGRAHV